MSERVKTHNLIGIPIGDWSDDGHGKCETFHLLIPIQFTQEMLSENYLKNKELFGFGLTDFACDYEESRITIEDYEMLKTHGFAFSETSEEVVDNTHYSGNDFYLNSKALVEIAVFFIGHGLEGFTARVKEPDFYMFGKWQGPETMIGYGLFS